jgi:hypothetical protein
MKLKTLKMKTDPNAPINPYKHLNCNGQIDDQYKGLTKREYFAAMAMQGLLAQKPNRTSFSIIAMESVSCANALINELNRE